MYLIALIKCGETRRDEGRRKELERSRKVFASITPSLRASMVPAFAAQLGHDIAPIYEEQEEAARKELKAADPKKLITEYEECLKEVDREMAVM